MRSCDPKSTSVAFLLALGLLFPVSSSAQQSVDFYDLGVTTAVADYCGLDAIVIALTMRYDKLKDFNSGFRVKEGAYFKRGARKINCDELAVELEAFLKGVREGEAWAAEQGIDLYVTLSPKERKAALDRVYSDVMASVLAKDAKWDTDRRGRSREPISTYRSTEVHGRSHKSVAACLSWDDESASLRYLGWSAEKGRDWKTTKYVALRQCRNLRLRERLHCECQSIDHDDENVLSLPDYILSRYERLNDVGTSGGGSEPDSSN